MKSQGWHWRLMFVTADRCQLALLDSAAPVSLEKKSVKSAHCRARSLRFDVERWTLDVGRWTLKLVRCPRSIDPTLVTLPSMSRLPGAPFSFSAVCLSAKYRPGPTF